MSVVDELVAFVRQQLDRQEAALIAYRDHRASEGQCVNILGDDPADYSPYDSCDLHIATAEAAEYRDATYGLAEVEAERRILAEHGPGHKHTVDGSRCYECGAEPCGQSGSCPICGQDGGCETVRLLAQPYAGRDGWREEWRA